MEGKAAPGLGWLFRFFVIAQPFLKKANVAHVKQTLLSATHAILLLSYIFYTIFAQIKSFA
jgi:hypothetical protein